MEVENVNEQHEELLKDLGFQKFHQRGIHCSEQQGMCEDSHSEEKIKLMTALSSQQKKFLNTIKEQTDALTRGDLIELLTQQREMLLSARDCLAARADSAVMKTPVPRKRIVKKTRTGRKRMSGSSDTKASSDGCPILLLPQPVDAEAVQNNEQFLNNSFEDFEYRGALDFPMSPRRVFAFPEGTTDDDFYGMKRLEADNFERNLYFGLSESMLEFPDSD